MNYFWIRIFNYVLDRDDFDKGILLDEFYIKGENINRTIIKEKIKEKYIGKISEKIMFAKPRKKDGIYAIIMESDKFFYDRFYLEIDTYCFCCHKKIKGKACEFPKQNLLDNIDIDLEDKENTAYFCSYDCKRKFNNSLIFEGEFQEKEPGDNGNIFGYIYLIYNRSKNKYYIGQTRYMPFFRWQEHIKNGGKGEIEDLTFNVITSIKRDYKLSEEENQEYLNNIEAWWISKYIEEGKAIFNLTKPKLTITEYKKRFNEMIAKTNQLSLF